MRFERHMDAHVRREVVTLRGARGTVAPVALERERAGALAADMGAAVGDASHRNATWATKMTRQGRDKDTGSTGKGESKAAGVSQCGWERLAKEMRDALAQVGIQRLGVVEFARALEPLTPHPLLCSRL